MNQQELMRAKHDRYSEIPAHAATSVRLVSERNEKRYPHEPWYQETAEQQVVYAHEDVEEAYRILSAGDEVSPVAVKHIEQAIWRLAAARYKIKGQETKERVERIMAGEEE